MLADYPSGSPWNNIVTRDYTEGTRPSGYKSKSVEKDNFINWPSTADARLRGIFQMNLINNKLTKLNTKYQHLGANDKYYNYFFHPLKFVIQTFKGVYVGVRPMVDKEGRVLSPPQ